MKASPASPGARPRSLARRLLTPRIIGWTLTILVVIAAVLSTKAVHPDDDTGKREVFDAKGYADREFEPVILPEILATAADLVTVLDAIELDEDMAKADYGHSSNPYNPYSYAVHFTAVAGEAVDGIVELTVEGLSSDYTVELQLVPGTGTALRDVTGFVDLNEFLNQVEYLNASLEFNYKAEELVLKPFLSQNPADSLDGKTLEIIGAFTDNTPGVITVIPVSLTIVDAAAEDQ